jgi:aryl-alcohol dehydrogenase-like predicted oxidoreductase
MIEKRNFGTSGASLPVLGIGCWSFGSGAYWGTQDQKDVNEVVAKALDQGASYFDSAEAYNDGRSEEALGVALRGRRQEAIIGTKIPPEYTSPSVLREHCEASLRRLQTDWIDIYLVHWPIVDRSVEEAFATLQALLSEGKIRAIGVSNFGCQQLTQALQTGARIEVNQLCYNLLSRALELELMPLCASHHIGIQAYMPLMQGLLTGKYNSADEMPAVRTRTRQFRGDRTGSRHGEPGAEVETFTALAGIRQMASEMGVPMAWLSMAWILAHPEVTCIIPGIRNAGQLGEAVSGVGLRLDPVDVARLDQLTESIRKKLGPSLDYFQAGDHGRIW